MRLYGERESRTAISSKEVMTMPAWEKPYRDISQSSDGRMYYMWDSEKLMYIPNTYDEMIECWLIRLHENYMIEHCPIHGVQHSK